MKINEVMKLTGLTKKAIYYYEEEGLINPIKNDENNYRLYKEQDVNKLRQINSLRKLEVPIKNISDVLDNPKNIKKIMAGHLKTIEDKINNLSNIRTEIEGLISNFESKELVAVINDLTKIADRFDCQSKLYDGYMQREIERLFPGNFGRFMYIFYSQFLNEPLDTQEKKRVWNDFINELDAVDEIEFPKEICSILDEIYNNLTEEQISQTKKKCKKFANEIISFESKSEEEQQVHFQNINKLSHNEEIQEDMKKAKIVADYIKQNDDVTKIINKYLPMLSRKYNEYIQSIKRYSELQQKYS